MQPLELRGKDMLSSPKSCHVPDISILAFSVQVLILCGSAYRPTEEIDLRSIGWGNIFQMPFKHMRDYRLHHLFPFFIYSGFELLFFCTGFALVCVLQVVLSRSGVGEVGQACYANPIFFLCTSSELRCLLYWLGTYGLHTHHLRTFSSHLL